MVVEGQYHGGRGPVPWWPRASTMVAKGRYHGGLGPVPWWPGPADSDGFFSIAGKDLVTVMRHFVAVRLEDDRVSSRATGWSSWSASQGPGPDGITDEGGDHGASTLVAGTRRQPGGHDQGGNDHVAPS